MHEIPITIFFTSFFTLIYILLSVRVGYMRGSPVLKLIFKMNKKITNFKLERNIRAHGNFSEYVPLFLILLFISEISNNFSFSNLLIISLIFLYGRLAHAICFSFYEYNPFLRISGMITTYLALFIFAIQLFYILFN